MLTAKYHALTVYSLGSYRKRSIAPKLVCVRLTRSVRVCIVCIVTVLEEYLPTVTDFFWILVITHSHGSARVFKRRRSKPMEKAKIRPLATPKPLNRSSQKLAGVITSWTAPGMQNFVATAKIKKVLLLLQHVAKIRPLAGVLYSSLQLPFPAPRPINMYG